MKQSEIAEKIARAAHKGQYRKMGDDKGKDYIVHPQRIAEKFNEKHDSLKAAAWLHDTMEDAKLTRENLKNDGIEDPVIDIVEILTRRTGETYLDFILRISADYNASLIKIEDLKDNMTSLAEGSLKDKYRMAEHILKSRKTL